MKSTITFLLALLFFLTTKTILAQIPVMRNDYNPNPQPGTTMSITRINSGAITQGASGAAITWNFSTLTTDNIKTGTFVSPNATPYGTTFAGATTAIAYTPGIEYGSYTANYEFFNITNSGIAKSGFVNNASPPIAVTYSDPKSLMPFPFTYTNTHSDNYEASYISGTFNVTETGSYSITADSYGTLVLPYGTIQNVLRVRILENMTQTIAGFDPFNYTIETYAWFHPKLAYPFFSITSESLNGSPQPSIIARYIQIPGFDDTLPDIVDVETVELSDGVKLYPNPAHDQTLLSFNILQTSPVQIVMMNLKGQVVLPIVNDILQAGQHQITIDVGSLQQGIYLIAVQTPHQKNTMRLVVQ